MAKVIIHKLGPIVDCAMEIDHFTVLTGAQASGKSTVAKCVYFCRTIKDGFSKADMSLRIMKNDYILIKSIS